MSGSPMMQMIVSQLEQLLHDEPEVYFVGGCVRDLLLGRPLHDLDLVTAGDAIGLARSVARAFHAAFVLLDEENGIARVVLRGNDEAPGTTIDFARMRGDTLAEDLAARDLTVNAMAMRPDDFGRASRAAAEPPVIDPLGGQDDLRAGLLRAASAHAFFDDPLRTMRTVRFAGELGFAIVPETAARVRQAAGLLPRVAWERIRDELARLLECPHAAAYLPLLQSLELLPHVLPELTGPAGGQLADGWERVCCLEWITAQLGGSPVPPPAAETPAGPLWRPAALRHLPELALDLPHTAHLQRYLAERLAEQSRSFLLKLAAMLRTDTPGQDWAALGQQAGRRLRLSTRQALSLGHLLSFREWATDTVTRRYVYRLYRDTGESAAGVLLLALADSLAQLGRDVDTNAWNEQAGRVRQVLSIRYEQGHAVIDPPRLLDGSEMIRALGLQPGPLVGDLLEEIREAQADGQVQTPAEALAWARRALGD